MRFPPVRLYAVCMVSIFRSHCRPHLSDQKRMGLFVSDEATQTDETHIMEVKQVTQIIETVLQVWLMDVLEYTCTHNLLQVVV